MPSGGKRVGAGRPATLDYFEKILVGDQCERRWIKAIKNKHRSDMAKELPEDELKEELKSFKGYLVGWTRNSDGKSARSIIIELSEREEIPERGYPKPILDMAKKLQYRRKILDEKPTASSRHSNRAWTYTRPLGQRKIVIREVADWAKVELGKPVSERMVESCWKLYRSEYT